MCKFPNFYECLYIEYKGLLHDAFLGSFALPSMQFRNSFFAVMILSLLNVYIHRAFSGVKYMRLESCEKFSKRDYVRLLGELLGWIRKYLFF